MKKVTVIYHVILCFIFSVSFFSCDSAENDFHSTTHIEVKDCNSLTVDDFDRFIGLDYGAEERELQYCLGDFTSGLFTADSSAFIYHFNRVDRVPISVWVSTETGKVVTIFMEVVSIGENFQLDLEEAISEFNILDCDASWFGLSVEEIKARMGEPSEEAMSAEGVTLLSYDSDDFLFTVAFKEYEQQENQCSSVSVNWFYQ